MIRTLVCKGHVLVSNCRGLCARYDTMGGGKDSAYKQGYKRCAVCEVFIKELGVRCPCCGLPLRTRRRSW